MPFRICGNCGEAVIIGKKCKCQTIKEKIKPKRKKQPPHSRQYKPVEKQSLKPNKKESDSTKYLKKFGISKLKEVINH